MSPLERWALLLTALAIAAAQPNGNAVSTAFIICALIMLGAEFARPFLDRRKAHDRDRDKNDH
jgi:hypothetical protein